MGSLWTHAICDTCWTLRCLDRGQLGRRPTRVGEEFRDPNEVCCFCGGPGSTGIFVRQHKDTLPNCPGHTDD